MERVMTKVIDALNVHLRYYEQNSKDGRGKTSRDNLYNESKKS